MSNKFARQQDANHIPMVEAYEKLGVCVLDLSRVAELTRPGCPDLLCSLHGYTWLSEVKIDTGEMNPAQVSFVSWWKGPVRIVRTIDDVIAVVAAVKQMTGAGKWIGRPKELQQ